MKSILVATTLLLSFLLAANAAAVPMVYTNKVMFLADLVALEGSTIHESFEDDAAWADSRNSISSPGSTPAVSSQGVL